MLENIFKKTFDVRKLEEDKERLRNAYQTKGYFRATVLKHDLETRDQKGRSLFPIPLLKKKKAKLADIRVTLDEGEQYRRGKLSFTDVELFRVPDQVLGPVFAMTEGAIFDVEKLRKGMENLKKLYGEFGYIDFVAEPSFEFREENRPRMAMVRRPPWGLKYLASTVGWMKRVLPPNPAMAIEANRLLPFVGEIG